MKLKFHLIFICSLITNFLFAQRDTIPINTNWKFAIDVKGEGIAQNWSSKELPNPKTVNLPHTWNVEQENQNHYGWGWYSYLLHAPKDWKNKNIILQFGAINHTSNIYLNGKKIAENIGDGFNKIAINLSGKLNYGANNRITIAVNNEYSTRKVPFASSFDWPNDGGLIRKVALIISEQPAAQFLHAQSKLNLADSSGSLQLKLGFEQASPDMQFAIHIAEENQVTKNIIYNKILSPRWQQEETTVSIDLPRVNPWHFDFPNLYKISVTVLKNKKAVDKISATTGFREIEMKKGQVFLNGEPVKLMGVEWSAGSNPNYGFAEPDAEIVRHCKLMKDVNTIFTRTHIQQDEVFYDFCDRNGILVQQEIPLWGPETPANDTIRAIAMKQLERMVGNFYNHPSIFSWAVGNELRGRDADVKRLIDDLMQRTRELDSTRMTAYVSNTLTSSFSNHPGFVPDGASQGDYLMMNEYGGSWWPVPAAKIGDYLDSIHMSYPDKTFMISEFGTCQPNFNGGDKRRVEDIIYHMAVYESKPYVQGAIYFDLTDYRTHYPGTTDENRFRHRIHGVYNMYGNPKPSMKVLREMSSPVEVQVQNTNGWPKDKVSLVVWGSVGLPQHIVSGYKLYVSKDSTDYKNGKVYNLPRLKPGERTDLEVDDADNGKGVITVVRPNGYIVSQQQYSKKEVD